MEKIGETQKQNKKWLNLRSTSVEDFVLCVKSTRDVVRGGQGMRVKTGYYINFQFMCFFNFRIDIKLRGEVNMVFFR